MDSYELKTVSIAKNLIFIALLRQNSRDQNKMMD